jgi:hypothetical protein
VSGFPRAARWLVVVGVGAVLAWASVHAGRAARAGPDWFAAMDELKAWPPERVPPKQAWSSVYELLQGSRTVEPANPKIHELLGLVAARRLDDYEMLQGATAHYVHAIMLRPISPVSWANLAEARYLVGDTSRLFEIAVENAVQLGPSDPQTQIVVALYGLAVLDEVKPPARAAIEAAVAAGMRRDPGQMLSIAQRRGRLDVACRYLPETRRKMDPRWLRTCEQAAAGTYSVR